MTRSGRVLRVFTRLVVGSVSAACGLGLAGELVVPAGQPGTGGQGDDLGGANEGGEDAAVSNDLDATTYVTDPEGGSFTNQDSSGMASGQHEASIPPGQCNFTGTWATKLTIPVSWVPQGLTGVILNPGSGTIGQWILQSRTQSGTALTDTTVVCEIDLPDFQGTIIAGSETYGVRFPNSLFDNHYLPSFTIAGTVSSLAPDASYTTTPSAALLGIAMASPTTDPWPSAIVALTEEVDSDRDGNLGVTALAAQGSSYSDIPTDLEKDSRATAVFVVIRQVTQVSGTVTDCNQLTDSNGDSKYAIDSHVIGCELEGDGGTCSAAQWGFIDGTQPVFTPSGGSTFATLRMPLNATCAQVRQALP